MEQRNLLTIESLSERILFSKHLAEIQLIAIAALLCFLPIPSHGTERLTTVKLQGERYVSLHKWARSANFDIAWDKKGKDVVVTSKWSKLVFTVNSRKATINGANVWLTSGILAGNDTLYVGERDLDTLITPILYPPRLGKGKEVRTVVIAAGHGGKDPGYVLKSQQEKKYTLLLAKTLKEMLEASGLKVVMIRDTDVYHHPETQAARANRAKADLFVTVHYNAASVSSAKGVETFCLTPVGATPTNGGRVPSKRSPGNKYDSHNALLAFHVHRSIVNDMDLEDRGIRRAGFLVLREVSMPGILIEGGFMSNPSDARKIFDADKREKMARSITDGILAYKRLVERN